MDKYYFTYRSKRYNAVNVKPVLRIFNMQEPHVRKLLNEASCHISDAIKLDGTGNVESAVKHYSVVVEKLDIALKDMTGEKALFLYNKERAVVAKRIAIIWAATHTSQSA